jgi:hypothetical protein
VAVLGIIRCAHLLPRDLMDLIRRVIDLQIGSRRRPAGRSTVECDKDSVDGKGYTAGKRAADGRRVDRDGFRGTDAWRGRTGQEDERNKEVAGLCGQVVSLWNQGLEPIKCLERLTVSQACTRLLWVTALKQEILNIAGEIPTLSAENQR